MDELAYASQTDVGIRRSHNQDAHVTMPAGDAEQWRQRGHVFLVADGMGAHAVGELASKIAVDNIPHIYAKSAQEGTVLALRKAFVEGNLIIHQRGEQNREFRGMGTTATALVIRPEGAWVGHVGDSRAYRIRAGSIEQLTFDHSLLWELARRQHKHPDELRGIPPNVIVRSLGPEPLVQVDVEGPHPIEPGDAFLLCSDGLSGQVSDREIGAVVTALPPDEACHFLIQLANLQGGPDNITVVIARVGGGPKPPAPSGSEVMFRAGASVGPTLRQRLTGLTGTLPGSLIMLGLGIVLAGAALWLTYAKLPGGLVTFLLAGISLLIGLVTLMVQNMRETREAKTEEAPRPVQVYRQTSCVIDDSLLQRVAHANETLAVSIRERGWDFDKAGYDRHRRRAQHFQDQATLLDAFREQSRALLILMDTVHRQRGGREEEFKPLWDRAKDSSKHAGEKPA